MAHFKKKTTVEFGREVRLRRDRKSSRPSLTKGMHFSSPPNPDPKGKQPTTAWVLYKYPEERRRRKRRAVYKRVERKQQLTRAERLAFRDQD